MSKLFFLFVILAITTIPSFATHPGEDVTLFHFQSNLQPHGEWICTEEGMSAWRPLTVAVDWRPYVVGRWVWSPRGWYWSSREPWAWATYHYGRWHYDSLYGWVWVPGYEWAPAWVEWRYGDDCVGWAPLGYYANSFALTVRWSTPAFWWSFVDCRYMTSPSVDRFVYRTRNNDKYIHRTRVIGNGRRENGIVHSGGPRFSDIERRSGTRIDRIEIPDRVVPDRQRESREEIKERGNHRKQNAQEQKRGRDKEDSRISSDDRRPESQARESRRKGREEGRKNNSERERERLR